MIGEIIETVLWTAWVQGEKPTSAILIAEPESGKTKSLERYRYTKGIVYISDVTMYGLTQKIQTLRTNKDVVNHIIIPDFLNPLSRSQSVVKSFIQFVNSLIEEGVGLIKTGSISFEVEAQCGILTAITSEKFKQKRRIWRDIGFISRMLPITYKYSISTIDKIFDSIVDQKQSGVWKQPLNIGFPSEKVDVKLSKFYARQMIPFALLLAKPQKMYGIRLLINFNAMLKATALKDGRHIVRQRDVDKLKKLCRYINYDFREI